ncbi:hypothetical protein MRB53_040087 [Persea americana]|nr:hypothetical protein MRB53_040087 [Persea americana]
MNERRDIRCKSLFSSHALPRPCLWHCHRVLYSSYVAILEPMSLVYSAHVHTAIIFHSCVLSIHPESSYCAFTRDCRTSIPTISQDHQLHPLTTTGKQDKHVASSSLDWSSSSCHLVSYRATFLSFNAYRRRGGEDVSGDVS